MRMRNRAHLEERLDACRDITLNDLTIPEGKKGKPLHIEIGCGKGGFITQTAIKNPSIEHIAVEKVANVIVLAMEKAKALEIKNLSFICGDFRFLSESIKDGSVDRIYLNFSDPWPKKGYAKRRLTHDGFLEIYKRILAPGGEIWFKTDNRILFDFSLESFQNGGFSVSSVTYDLHNSDFKDNIMTEYEERFSSIGTPICRLVARL